MIRRKIDKILLYGTFIVVCLTIIILRSENKNISSFNITLRSPNRRVEGAWIKKYISVKPFNSPRDENNVYEKKGINVTLSNKISLHRNLPDVRNPLCHDLNYHVPLSTASVIIVFYNEPWSVLLRTVYSVLNRSQPKLLKEIILVDDHSNDDELLDALINFVTKTLPKKVKLIHLPKRAGLVKARLKAAKIAVGDTLVFLDAQCEVTKEWLPPLLMRIQEKPDSVALPIVDVISPKTLEYKYNFSLSPFPVGGFRWSGDFMWTKVQKNDVRNSSISPTKSPTMSGGIFAIDRNYFWEIGAYDDQMEGWGGENLEMSFRVWQCGGRLEVIPCSRVGHIFREFFPYDLLNDKDTVLINSERMANVWMDDYKRLFYLYNSEYKAEMPQIGDIKDRLELRENLKCKSFKWYLDNVYPEKFIPDENVKTYGRFHPINQYLCLDTFDADESHSYFLRLNGCSHETKLSQLFSLSNSGEIRTENSCAAVDAYTEKVIMVSCDKYTVQTKWLLNEDGSIVHNQSGLCLDATGLTIGQEVKAQVCEKISGQYWTVD